MRPIQQASRRERGLSVEGLHANHPLTSARRCPMSQKTKHEEQQRPLGGNTASFSLNRREFLGGAAGLAAALATGGAVLETVLVPGAAAAVGITAPPPVARVGEAPSTRVEAAARGTKRGLFPRP